MERAAGCLYFLPRIVFRCVNGDGDVAVSWPRLMRHVGDLAVTVAETQRVSTSIITGHLGYRQIGIITQEADRANRFIKAHTDPVVDANFRGSLGWDQSRHFRGNTIFGLSCIEVPIVIVVVRRCYARGVFQTAADTNIVIVPRLQ